MLASIPYKSSGANLKTRFGTGGLKLVESPRLAIYLITTLHGSWTLPSLWDNKNWRRRQFGRDQNTEVFRNHLLIYQPEPMCVCAYVYMYVCMYSADVGMIDTPTQSCSKWKVTASTPFVFRLLLNQTYRTSSAVRFSREVNFPAKWLSPRFLRVHHARYRRSPTTSPLEMEKGVETPLSLPH